MEADPLTRDALGLEAVPPCTLSPESSVSLMGFIDSVIGIITGAIAGIAPQIPGLLQALGVPG